MMKSKASVLLVQPDGDNRDMYAEFLRLHGFSVFAFADADRAVDSAPVANVIVTGILLHGSMDGLEWVRRLRANQRTADMPIIVLTACAMSTHRQHAMDAGCDAFLPMPCLPEMLLETIRRLLLRRVRGTPASVHGSRSGTASRKAKGELTSMPSDRAS